MRDPDLEQLVIYLTPCFLGWTAREHARARGGGQQSHEERGLEEGQGLHHQRQDERKGKRERLDPSLPPTQKSGRFLLPILLV